MSEEFVLIDDRGMSPVHQLRAAEIEALGLARVIGIHSSSRGNSFNSISEEKCEIGRSIETGFPRR